MKSLELIKKAPSDIRFWIILFFIIRLFNIDAPIFDSHNWRQADGYSIARNFVEIDANPLYPRIDHAGKLTGIMGSEFPIMNYLVYWLYLIFGVNWWQGRLLNLLVSSIGTWFFFKTVQRYINHEIALTAALFLLSSIWLAHSRKFMPDVFSTSLVLSGVYFGWRYLHDKKGLIYLLLFGGFCLAGLLSKLPSFVMTALLVPALLDKGINFREKANLVVVSTIIIGPVIAWYFYWAPMLTADYGYFYFYMGSSISESLYFLIDEWPNTLNRYFYALHFIGFGLYIIGVYLVIKHRNQKLLITLIAVFCLQLLYMLNTGETFAHHSYYIVPFVPAMAIFAAYSISRIKKTWLKKVLVFVVIVEGIGNQQHDFRIKQSDTYKLRFESVADIYTKREDLIAINNDVNPASLYFAHRKGWSISSTDSIAEHYQQLRNDGCKLIIWDKHREKKPRSVPHFEMIAEDEDFALYKPKTTDND